ncbi:vitamin K epoxide reductase family protein [Longimicrobium sp.]|uniref:vitamin K epoxide reductase family protein n=1 Tax=Longimicrobium sp. TaxID=2029185 RepID=UPI002E347E42|nr:vitamin K epoxide reductase family protein [Longimicrobium sp.]HEX6042652.1 vitamin K epoxide reductase family protein [Longimicrobium sp.]
MSTVVTDGRMDAVDAEEYLEERPPVTRMAIAVLALIGLMLSTYLSMYKLGYLGEIQCTLGGCEKVQNSSYSYFLGQPVAVWGLGAYIALLALAVAGIQPRLAGSRWVALGLFGVAAVGVLFSAYLTYLEAFVIHAWCQWCVISAILVTLIFLLSIPGLRQAR